MVELISEWEVFICFRIALDTISRHMVAEPKNEDTIKTLKVLFERVICGGYILKLHPIFKDIHRFFYGISWYFKAEISTHSEMSQNSNTVGFADETGSAQLLHCNENQPGCVAINLFCKGQAISGVRSAALCLLTPCLIETCAVLWEHLHW